MKQQNTTEKSEDLDQLESWHIEFSADLLPEDSEPTTRFDNRIVVLYDHPTGTLHLVCLVESMLMVTEDCNGLHNKPA